MLNVTEWTTMRLAVEAELCELKAKRGESLQPRWDRKTGRRLEHLRQVATALYILRAASQGLAHLRSEDAAKCEEVALKSLEPAARAALETTTVVAAT